MSDPIPRRTLSSASQSGSTSTARTQYTQTNVATNITAATRRRYGASSTSPDTWIYTTQRHASASRELITRFTAFLTLLALYADRNFKPSPAGKSSWCRPPYVGSSEDPSRPSPGPDRQTPRAATSLAPQIPAPKISTCHTPTRGSQAHTDPPRRISRHRQRRPPCELKANETAPAAPTPSGNPGAQGPAEWCGKEYENSAVEGRAHRASRTADTSSRRQAVSATNDVSREANSRSFELGLNPMEVATGISATAGCCPRSVGFLRLGYHILRRIDLCHDLDDLLIDVDSRFVHILIAGLSRCAADSDLRFPIARAFIACAV